MSVKIISKDGDRHNWNESKNLLPQIQDAEKIIIDTRKDLGSKAESFLKSLVSLTAINVIKPFDIEVVRSNNLSEMKLNRMAKKVKKEMILSWALQQALECSDKCDHKLSQMIEMVKGK